MLIPACGVLGFLVSLLILQQGVSIMGGSFRELTDAGVSPRTHQSMTRALQPLVAASPATTGPAVLAISELRARRAGALTFVDLTAAVPRTLSVADTASLEEKITRTLKEARKEVAEVRVRFRPVDDEKERQ